MTAITIDVGNAYVKVGAKINGAPVFSKTRSVVGAGEIKPSLLNVKGRNVAANIPNRISFNDLHFLVGEGVADHAIPTQSLSLTRLSHSATLRALLYDAIGQCVKEGAHISHNPVIGFPVDVLSDASEAKKIICDLASWLIGSHLFDRATGTQKRSKRIGLKITGRIIPVPQPFGTLYSWIYKNGGDIVSAIKGYYGICDVGGGTTDLYTTRDGLPLPRHTKGRDIGVGTAALHLIETAHNACGINLELPHAISLLQEKAPMVAGHDLTVLCERAKEVLAERVMAFVAERWGKQRPNFDLAIYTGGGSTMIKDYIKDGLAVFAVNPVMENVYGMYKLAEAQND